jgi:hypothetical protein
MKFLKALLATLLLVTAPVILESCCFNSCESCFSGRNNGPPHYDFTGMTMKVYLRDQYTEVTTAPTRLSNVQFSVNIEANYTSMMKTFGSAAYACSPAPEIANQKITSIKITSNNDLASNMATIFKGDDLGALFQVETEMRRGEIADILNQQFLGRRLMFFSDVDVTSDQTHIFTFHITLDNGDEFEMVTGEVNLKEE